jgi:hypothetical protein
LPNHTLKGSFWWRDMLKLLGKYKSCSSVLIQSGTTCSLWHDPWSDPVPSQAFPQLFSFTRSEFISFNKARAMDISNLFHLHFQRRPLIRRWFLHKPWMTSISQTHLTFGVTDGDIPFPLNVRIFILLVLGRFIKLINGCGNHRCKNDTKFSSGCYLRTG